MEYRSKIELFFDLMNSDIVMFDFSESDFYLNLELIGIIYKLKNGSRIHKVIPRLVR